MTTDSDGWAAAVLTLGPDDGTMESKAKIEGKKPGTAIIMVPVTPP